jgi:hypothetical protein
VEGQRLLEVRSRRPCLELQPRHLPGAGEELGAVGVLGELEGAFVVVLG